MGTEEGRENDKVVKLMWELLGGRRGPAKWGKETWSGGWRRMTKIKV